MDRAELAAFLRTRRARLGPGDVGLPTAARRRTPGLRREEVALLAGVSVDYYTRLEQARGPHPSRQVLAALARSLRLTGDERDHLFRLAGEPAPEPRAHSSHVRPGVLHLLDRLADGAVVVATELGDVLAWTPLAQALFGDFSALPAGRRNLYRMFFTGQEEQHRLLPEDRERAALANVADLRATWARRHGDPAVQRLVEELRRASPLFERLWAAARHRPPAARPRDHPLTAGRSARPAAWPGLRYRADSPDEDLVDPRGRLEIDEHAPSWWTLADPEGNEVDVATTA